MYRRLFVFLIPWFFVHQSFANCTGSGSIKTCYDTQTGNSYTVSEFGNSTYVTGTNLRTGHTWSQTSNHIGNTTYTNGLDANGRPWNSTTTHIGNTVYQNGVDSDGNSFSNTKIIQQPTDNEQDFDSDDDSFSSFDDDDD